MILTCLTMCLWPFTLGAVDPCQNGHHDGVSVARTDTLLVLTPAGP
jgi:hypothetical protein